MRYIVIAALVSFLNGSALYAQGFGQGGSSSFNPTIIVEEKEPLSRGFILLLGPKVNYYKGTGRTPIKPYDENRVSFQADAQLGYIFNQRRANRGNFLGVFASGGIMNAETMNLFFEDQDFFTQILEPGKNNVFYQVEAGMYIAEFLRLSGGVGRQQFVIKPEIASKNTAENADLTKTIYTLQYYTSTVGIKINLGAVDWVVDVNWMFGGNLGNLVARPSTGFLVKF